MTDLQAPNLVFINSASQTTYSANPNDYVVIDTATAAVTVTLPVGTAIGKMVTIQNAPTNGFQVGGTVAGHSITINPGTGETVEGNSTDSLGAPTSAPQASCRRYFPTGANSGTGTGKAGITGWTTN